VRLRDICPAGRRRGLAFAGDREVADRSGRRAAAPRRQRAAAFLFRGGSRSQSLLESETDTEAAEEVPEGEKKSSIAALLAETMQRIDPQDPRTAPYAYLNGRTAACDVDNAALVYPFGCNASQKLAVQRALGNRVSVVEGPPGTGKTQTILNIVANLLMQGKTVGVVSNNNAAVDNVRDKLSKYEYGALMAELGNRTRRQAFFADKQQDFMPDPAWRLPAEERTALRTRLGELSAVIDELFRVDAELADLRTKRSYAQCEYRHLLRDNCWMKRGCGGSTAVSSVRSTAGVRCRSGISLPRGGRAEGRRSLCGPDCCSGAARGPGSGCSRMRSCCPPMPIASSTKPTSPSFRPASPGSGHRPTSSVRRV
ncbi:MAG: AAA domain-containing protein, partial [Eggerthella lenta]